MGLFKRCLFMVLQTINFEINFSKRNRNLLLSKMQTRKPKNKIASSKRGRNILLTAYNGIDGYNKKEKKSEK